MLSIYKFETLFLFFNFHEVRETKSIGEREIERERQKERAKIKLKFRERKVFSHQKYRLSTYADRCRAGFFLCHWQRSSKKANGKCKKYVYIGNLCMKTLRYEKVLDLFRAYIFFFVFATRSINLCSYAKKLVNIFYLDKKKREFCSFFETWRKGKINKLRLHRNRNYIVDMARVSTKETEWKISIKHCKRLWETMDIMNHFECFIHLTFDNWCS